MRIAFAGTPEFALASLAALHAAGHDIVLVLSQPDRPAGRGLKLSPSPVKAWAVLQGLPVAQPRSLKLDGRYPEDAAATQAQLQELAPDLMVVAAYGLILPAWVLALPTRGCLNVHGSLLPRWRGAAPIHRAIEAGDRETGITIMQMDIGLDTGPMLLTQALAIGPQETTATLHDRMATLGGQLLVQAIARLDQLPAQPQPEAGISYAHKIDKAEAAIDWALPAAQIERRVRAFDPFPGATFQLDGQTLKLWQAQVLAAPDPAPSSGTVFSPGPQRLAIACADGALELLTVQAPGGKRLAMAQYLRGRVASS
jgi:methionyl-tRNA formyltransferase